MFNEYGQFQGVVSPETPITLSHHPVVKWVYVREEEHAQLDFKSERYEDLIRHSEYHGEDTDTLDDIANSAPREALGFQYSTRFRIQARIDGRGSSWTQDTKPEGTYYIDGTEFIMPPESSDPRHSFVQTRHGFVRPFGPHDRIVKTDPEYWSKRTEENS